MTDFRTIGAGTAFVFAVTAIGCSRSVGVRDANLAQGQHGALQPPDDHVYVTRPAGEERLFRAQAVAEGTEPPVERGSIDREIDFSGPIRRLDSEPGKIYVKDMAGNWIEVVVEDVSRVEVQRPSGDEGAVIAVSVMGGLAVIGAIVGVVVYAVSNADIGPDGPIL